MTVIDVDAVGFENLLEFIQESLAGSLNAQHIADFSDVIGSGAVGI